MLNILKRVTLALLIVAILVSIQVRVASHSNSNSAKDDTKDEVQSITETEVNTEVLIDDKISDDKEYMTNEIVEEEVPELEYAVPISEEDQIILLKIAYAEAGNQDIDGKALVMLVVLNRVKSNEFPDTISEVVFQKNQFSPVANGSYERATTTDPGCLEALELVMQGYDISKGATYFESLKSYDSWHYRNLNFLFEHGGHWFYN